MGTELAAALEQVTVILVSYNSAHCMAALGQQLRACPHVIVADNASADDSLAQARQHLPQAQLLALPQNLGFGAANNRALAQVRTPFALLLNPDCELGPEGIARLLRSAQDWPEAAIVAPQLLTAAGRPEINYRWPATHWKSRGEGAQGPACVGFLCGAALLLRLSHFKELGFFDESFFLYYEDDDLCARLFAQRKPLVLEPAVTAIHRSRGSVRGRSPWRSEYLRGFHHAQSKLRFTQKHVGTPQARRLRRQLLLATTFALPLRLLAFSPRLLARMAGRWAGGWQWQA